MGYELRTNTIEPRRHTYDAVSQRFGDKAGSRYQEATYGAQPEEHFGFRPFWSPEHEIYDPDFSAVKLADPYVYTDPRQYYYATYVANRAADMEAFGRTLKYAEARNLLGGLPPAWLELVKSSYLPLRHYEAGAKMITINGSRFAWGNSISQPLSFAAFDRIGNAQMHSMIGLAVGGGSAEVLHEVKQTWLQAEHLQPLRKYVELALVEKDWVSGVIAIDLVDAQLYPLMHIYTDEHALLEGAGSVSLLGQHFTSWYADQKKWLDPLIKAWVTDEKYGADNLAALQGFVGRFLAPATEAVQALATRIDGALQQQGAEAALEGYRVELLERYAKLGLASAETD